MLMATVSRLAAAPVTSSTRRIAMAALSALLAAGCAGLTTGGTRSGGVVLAADGSTDYRIVISADASPSTRHGARELQGFLGQMTGAEFPIVTDAEAPVAAEILLGNSARLQGLGLDIDFHALGPEGYTLRTVGPKLVIAGGDERGNLYGVYALLEEHFGCRWYTMSYSRIPEYEHLVLLPTDETYVPPLEYREILMKQCYDGDWAARNRLNGLSARLRTRHGGGEGVWGVHTFYRYVPPEEHFDDHPEYFSLVDGKRTTAGAQLCLTNEDVFHLLVEGVRQVMRQHPEYTAYSVSQMDCYGPCQCGQCQAIVDREESQMGPVLHMVNRIAAAVEDEFPGKCISTLAYQYTRKPPKHVRPRHNVVIRLCSIECNFGSPLADSTWPQNQAFARDLEGWSRIHDRIYIWNYTTSFKAYLTPYPNRHTVGPDLRLFTDHNVRGVMEQNVYNTLGGEMDHLDAFLLAKLLWNPQANRDAVMDDFLTHVYGAAAGPIRAYLDLVERKVAEDDVYLSFNLATGGDLLTPEIMSEGDRLWDAAEAAVRYDAAALFRVRQARMSLDYAFVFLACEGGYGAWRLDQDSLALRPDPTLVERLDRFLPYLDYAGVDRLTEWGVTKKEFIERCQHLRDGGRALALLPAVEVEDPRPGLAYAVYDGRGTLAANRQTLEPRSVGVTDRVTVEVAPSGRGYGIAFSGYVEAPRDGIYTFTMITDDAGYLEVGGQEIIANRHSQQWGVRMSGHVALTRGHHPIEMAWQNAYGAHALLLEWTPPGGESGPIPPTYLASSPATAIPDNGSASP